GGGGVPDYRGADIADGRWSVLDYDLLAEPLRKPLSYQPCHNVGATSGGKSDNDADWPRRISLRPSEARRGRQRGSARSQMQKLSAGKIPFLTSLPLYVTPTPRRQLRAAWAAQ